MVAPLAGDTGRPTISEEKQNQVEELFQDDPRRLLQEFGASSGVHHKLREAIASNTE